MSRLLDRLRRRRGGTVPGVLVMGQPVQLSRGQAVLPGWVLDLHGDELRRLAPGTDFIAAEDVEDER